MAAVVPKGFEIVTDDQPVPDSRLPSGGPEGWQVDSPEVVADLSPGDHKIGMTRDGKELYRKILPDGTSFEGYYDDNGGWIGYGEISGDLNPEPLSLEEQEALPSPPEGFFYDETGQLIPEDDQEAAPEDEYNLPRVSTGKAGWRGLQAGALMGFDDELAAGAGALGNKVGQWLGMNDTEIPMSEVYQQILQGERDEKDAAWDQHPYAYGAAYAPGALLSAPFIGGRVAQGETALQSARALSGAGARVGAVGGAGNNEGDLGDLVGNTAEGALGGAILAPVIAPVARTVVDPIVQRGSRLVGNIRERMAGRAPATAADSGLEALASRSTQDPAAMQAVQQEMVRAGVDPRLVDVVNEEGRAVVRNAANKMTPAREDLRQHTEDVYAGMPDRVARQARDNISQTPGTARQLGHDIAEEQRLMGPRFDAVRNEPVALTPEIIRAFSTADARSALRRIGRQMTAEEQQDLNRFISSVNAAQRQIDPRLPPAIREQIERQLFQDSPLTVDIADKFSRVLTKAAEDQPALMRVAQDYANTVRGAARQQYPDYDNALTEMAGRAAVGEAASGTGRFGNNTSEFLGSPSDEYARTIANAGNDPRMVRSQDQAMSSEAEALRMRARDDVVDRATAGSGAQAPAVARQLSRPGIAQADRSRALLGDEGAERLQRGMGAELRRYQNTQYIDPGAGSNTASVAGDEADLAGGLTDAAANAASGGKWAAVRSVSNYLRTAGIRNVDAERLVRDAINPRRTNDAINYLTRRGMERERARSLVRSITANAGGRAGGVLSYDGSPEGPGRARASARSIGAAAGRIDNVQGEDE